MSGFVLPRARYFGFASGWLFCEVGAVIAVSRAHGAGEASHLAAIMTVAFSLIALHAIIFNAFRARSFRERNAKPSPSGSRPGSSVRDTGRLTR